MPSDYYTYLGKEVYDNDVARADDLNTINTAVDASFEQVETDINSIVSDSQFYSDRAQEWAENPYGVEVMPGQYSSLHWATEAADSASLALGSIPSFNNVTEMRAYAGPSQTINLKGHSSIGDGGQGTFTLRNEGGYVDDDGIIIVPDGGDGSVAFVRNTPDRTVYTLWYGPAGNNIKTIMINCLSYLVSIGGGELVINSGECTVTSSISKLVEADIDIRFTNGSKLIAAAGLSVPVINLQASTTGMTSYNLRIYSPNIDCSAGDSPLVGDQFCTAISALYYNQLIVENPILYGGEEPDNVNADAGITAGCDYIRITGGSIRGFNDGGVYLGGDNNTGYTGDGKQITIDGVLFERCSPAINLKREATYTMVTNCKFFECAGGIISNIVSPTLHPREIDVQGNVFKKISANITRFSGITKGSFSDNSVTDWGFLIDGTTPASGSAKYVLILQGSQNIRVNSNLFEMDEWGESIQRAVLLQNYTDLYGTTYIQGRNQFSNNVYKNILRAIDEADDGYGNHFFLENFIDINQIFGSTKNPDTIMIYTADNDSRLRTLKGSITSIIPTYEVVRKATSDSILAADSGVTFNTVGALSPVTLTLPSAAGGYVYSFVVMDQPLTIVTSAGDNIRTPSGAVSSITASLAGTFIKLRCMDTANWIIEGVSGTWV